MDAAPIAELRAGAKRRLVAYAAVFAALCMAFALAAALPWRGDQAIDAFFNLAVAFIALDVGLIALLRYYSQQDDQFLFIGSAFLSAAFLNGCQSIAAWPYFEHLSGSAPASVVPWRELAPRAFLSIGLFLSWLHWYRNERVRHERASAIAVYAAFGGLAVFCAVLFAVMPLPAGFQPRLQFPRPQEFAPFVFLALTLAGYLRKGKWQSDSFEHWLIFALVVSVISEPILALAEALYDAPHMLARVGEVTSSLCVYTGLLINMHGLFAFAAREAVGVGEVATGAFVEVNRRFCDLFGYDRSEMLRLDFAALSAAGTDGDLRRALAAAAAGRDRTLEWACRTRDGRSLSVEFSLQGDGAGKYLTATARDVTERNRAADELKQRDTILNAVTRASAQLASPPLKTNLVPALEILGKALDVTRVMVFLNLLSARPIVLAGWQRPECTAAFDKDAFEGINDEILARFNAQLAARETVAIAAAMGDPAMQRMLQRSRAKSMLLVPIFVDGLLWGVIGIVDATHERLWLAAETSALGTFAEVVGSMLARERTLASLHASEQEFRTIFSSVAEGIFLLDPATWRIVEVNPAGSALYGYTREELIGRYALELSPFVTAAVLDTAFKTAKAGRHESYERRMRAKDGRAFWADISWGTALFDGRELALVTLRDTSERKAAEEELKRRDNILHAVTLASAELAAPPLAAHLPRALEILGAALGVNRVMVIENPLDRKNIRLVAGWQSSNAVIDFEHDILAKIEDWPTVADWQAPLARGEILVTQAAEAAPAISKLLSSFQTKSVATVPFVADGAFWGCISIDDRASERRWLPAETDALGTLAEVIGSMIVRERTLASLHASEEEFRTIFDSAGDGIFLVDPATGRFLEANPKGCSMFGYTREEAIGLNVAALTPGVTPEMLADRIARSKHEGVAVFERQVWTKDGRVYWVEITVRGAVFRGREVSLAAVRDVSQRKEAEAKIARMARIDALTELPNRREFVDFLEREIVRSKRDGTGCAVLYLDLDHFKDVNDTLGHPIGDRLLQAVAARLRTSIRNTDSLARFGGDEFAVLETELTGPEDAAALATKIVAAMAAPFPVDGTEIRTGASVGIALYGGDASEPETLLSYADVALYRAKSEGRGTYRFFTEAMDQDVRKRVNLAADLRGAIERSELHLEYQPQVELETGRIVGLEALARWRHPARAMVSPLEFIPIAEDTGLIVPLGKWVLREACLQMRRWMDAGIAPEIVAVNVSAVQFKRPLELEQDIAAILAESGVPASMLELELTETVLMEVRR